MRKKKLLYIPGMLSLIGLPVVLFFWGPKDPVRYTSLRLNLTSSAKSKPGIITFNNDYVYQMIKGKKLITVNIDGKFPFKYNDDEVSAFTRDENLSFVNHEIVRFRYVEDTNTVLKIHFAENCTYGNFVWTINQALIWDFKRYALIGNDLYFLHNPIYAASTETIEPIYLDYDTHWKEPTKWQKIKMQILYQWWDIENWFGYLFYRQKQNVLIAAGFLLLIVLPGIIKTRKYIKLNRFSYSLS